MLEVERKKVTSLQAIVMLLLNIDGASYYKESNSDLRHSLMPTPENFALALHAALHLPYPRGKSVVLQSQQVATNPQQSGALVCH